MICGNHDISFRALSACDNCGIYKEGQVYRLSDLIPAGHCYELLHSLLPYIITYIHKGWFKWERDKDAVTVCCPSVDNNICVQLKKITNGKDINFKYEIKNTRGECTFYKKGQIFEINKSAFSRLCWYLFNLIYPYLRIEHEGNKILCGVNNKKSIYGLLATEKT